jgi:hypothetical protein
MPLTNESQTSSISGDRANKSLSGQHKNTDSGCSPEVMMSLAVKSDPIKHLTDSLVRILFMRVVMVL